MNLRKLLAFLTLAIALPCFALAALPEKPRFGQETSDLKPEAGAHFGTLPNGLRYVVMANKEPKDRASLRLVVMAGALHETEEQRGLAHFLEHLAFNGSKHYPPGTLVEFFQRMGMSFGGDTNAYTSFDHTAYMLELPDTKPATLDEGFRVFADYADGLLLLDTSVDKERGIILSEKRARDSVEYRQFVAEFDFVLKGTRLPERMPIGLAPIIEQAKRDRFVDFYNTWYRPERMAVIVVGDFDPAAIEKQITAAFSTIKPRAAARPVPDLGQLASFKGIRATYHAEPEATATAVSIQTVTPRPDEPDTAAKRLEQLPRDLAVSMLNRRISILAKKEGAPFTAGKADVGESFDFIRNASIELTCKAELWPNALALAEQELRRALQYGFQPAELAEAAANLRNDLDQATKGASTRHSNELASSLVQALTEGSVFTSPADDQSLFTPALDKVTVAQCADALRAAFAAPGRFVSVMGNAKIDSSSTTAEVQITTAYEKSATVAVAAPEQVAEAKFGYTDFGPAGAIKEKKHIDDLDLTLVTFANGVRLNLKKTDFEANQIHVALRIGTGQLTEPKDKPGLSFFATTTFTAGGLGQHSVDDLQRILAGKTVQIGFQVREDALALGTFQGRDLAPTNREDLLLQLQLLAAYVTDAGYRPESIRVATKQFEQLNVMLEHTSNGPLRRDVPRLLANGDPRFGLPTKDALMARTLDEARAWLTPQLTQGPIEIAIVGDLDLDAAIAAVARTFGALPPRAAKPALEAERQTSFPAPFSKDFAISTEIPKGVVSLYWPTTDARNIQVVRRLNLLASVFSDRLRVKIREQLGESYSPQAFSSPSETYRNYGLFLTSITVDPAKAEQVITATLAIADDLAKNGVTADELERAKKPVLTMLRESARANAYWLSSVLGSAQEFPQRLDWCRSRYSDNEGVTAAELSELAKKYLPTTRAFRVTVVPERK